MAVFYFKYTGDLVGVNKWKDCRVMKNPKYRPGMPLWKMFIATMYKTKMYNDFRDSLESALRGVKLDGYYDLRLKMSMWRRKDSDGPVKAILDALEKSKVISTDNRIRDISIIRAYHHKNEKDILIIELFKPKERVNLWAGEKQLSFFGENN